MNYITNSFVGLRNYIGQSITEHKKLVIGGSLLIGGVATYLLAQRYLQQSAIKQNLIDRATLKEIYDYERRDLSLNGGTILLSKELINKPEQSTPFQKKPFVGKQLIHYEYETSERIDLKTWKLIETIKFKNLETTVTANPNISYDILTKHVTEWIKTKMRGFIYDAKSIDSKQDFTNFFFKYGIKAYMQIGDFPKGISDFNQKPTQAYFYLYKGVDSFAVHEFLSEFWFNYDIEKIPEMMQSVNPTVCFNLGDGNSPYCIGDMKKLIDQLLNDIKQDPSFIFKKEESQEKPKEKFGYLPLKNKPTQEDYASVFDARNISPEDKKNLVNLALEILSLPSNATKADIKKAYRIQTLEVHPDKNPSMEATEKFKKISAAYGFLMNQK